MPAADAPRCPDSPPPERYPFRRTSCACRLCSISCEHLPGALAPSDLPILAAHLGYGADVTRYARENLVVADGLTLALRDGRILSLPTLVPATGPTGACRHYAPDRAGGSCAVHETSPFGCAFIDAHMPDAEFRRRTDALYAEVLDDHVRAREYSRLAGDLRALGRVAPPLEIRRARLAQAMRREGL